VIDNGMGEMAGGRVDIVVRRLGEVADRRADVNVNRLG